MSLRRRANRRSQPMRRVAILLLTLAASTSMRCSPLDQRSADERSVENPLLILRDQGIVAGLLPSAGGRLVLLRTERGDNWLDSDSAEWSIHRASPTLDTPFSYSLFGATVWAGPQSAFWADQELGPTLKNTKAMWPPDPFLEWGHCAVRRKSASEVELALPPSPVSGLQLTKTYCITGPGELVMEVVATNTRSRTIHRDLWPDVHIDPTADVRVPVANEHAIRLSLQNGANPTPLTIHNGYAVWSGQPPGGGAWSAKAFLSAARQESICERRGEQLRINGSLFSPADVHPEQASVELFRIAADRPRLEVEMHSACRDVPPGGMLVFTMTFTIAGCRDSRVAK